MRRSEERVFHFNQRNLRLISENLKFSLITVQFAVLFCVAAAAQAAKATDSSVNTLSGASASAQIVIHVAPRMAQDFYVSPTGNDSNYGSQSSPWRAIGHAALLVIPGDT